MSLKAKIEAVIYASEEPVTLAQLIGLLGVEAQSELDAQEEHQRSLALTPAEGATESEAGDADALNAETLGGTEAEPVTDTDGATSEPEAEDEVPAATEAVADGQETGGGERESARVDESAGEPVPAPEGEAPAAETQEPAAAADTARAADVARDAKARERKLREYFRQMLDRLMAEYANGDRGLEIREVAGGFRLATKPEYHDAVRGFVKSLKPPLKLSLQALETLAVVAYKQPVTAPEVSEIRGVDSGGVLGSLMTRKLVTTAGRKQVIGRPILYKTTKDFLVRFGLKDINELPSIEEFEKMAGEFADNEPVQEEIPMDAPHGNRSEEAADSGESPALDEINAVPEPTNMVHESAEEIVSDKSYAPEGGNTEPVRHSEEAITAAEDVEPNAGYHEPQADGDDRDTGIADDIIVDGRISGIDPPDNTDDNPSAQDAEEQEAEKEG
ncbi:MAG TPA: SMC-Scp complex subunit ScpB [Acidobacteriaceae bacterium]|jgi:segregation and condensation protein B